MKRCLICNKDFKNLSVHNRHKHPEMLSNGIMAEAVSDIEARMEHVEAAPVRPSISEFVSARQKRTLSQAERYMEMSPEARREFVRHGGRMGIYDPSGEYKYRLVSSRETRQFELKTKCPDYQPVSYDEATGSTGIVGAEMAVDRGGQAAIGDLVLWKCPAWTYEERQKFHSEEGERRLNKHTEDAAEEARRVGATPTHSHKQRTFSGAKDALQFEKELRTPDTDGPVPM